MPDGRAGTAVAVAAVALLAVLGGCNLGPDGTPVPDRSPSTPRGGDAAATRGPVGLTADGVTDPWRLRMAHRQALENRSYTFAFRIAVRRAGTTRGRLDGTYRVSADRTRSIFEQDVDGDVPAWLVVPADLRRLQAGAVGTTGETGLVVPADLRRYRADDRVVVQLGEDRATEVRTTGQGSGPSSAFSTTPNVVYFTLTVVDTNVTGTVTRDGDTYYRVAGTARTVGETDRATDVAVSALISPAGVVSSFRTAYTVVPPDWAEQQRRVRVVRRFEYRAVGETTVERPAWAAGALANATPGSSGGEAANGTDGGQAGRPGSANGIPRVGVRTGDPTGQRRPAARRPPWHWPAVPSVAAAEGYPHENRRTGRGLGTPRIEIVLTASAKAIR